MKQDELISYWIQSSDLDFDSMMAMYHSKHYHWSLFIGHLVIEKLLKAYYVYKKDESYPMIHNLLRIAEKAGLDLNDEQQLFFSTVTGFNINARYDDFKQSFYQKCTQEYTVIWIEKIKTERSWIKNQLLK